MSIFITGACGFVGLALTESLLSQGHDVVGYDLSSPPIAARRLFGTLAGRFQMVIGDVCDSAHLLDAMRDAQPEMLVSLAAITADANRERAVPARIIEVNVAGVLSAVSAAAKCGVKRVLHVSSGAVYGASGDSDELLDELTTPLRPESLYGISKQAAEAAALRLAHLHGLDLVVGRLGTCFGPWEADTGVRDTLSAPLQVVTAAANGNTAILPRAGKRDWLYVRDAAAAMIALLTRSKLPLPIYNLAAGFEWSVSDWCKEVERWYPGFDWHVAGPGEAASIEYYASYDRASMSNARLCSDTDFTPRFDIVAAATDFRMWRDACDAPLPSSSLG